MTRVVVVAAAFAVVLGGAVDALACSFDVGFVVSVPADGESNVPANPLLLVRLDEVSNPRLFDDADVEVPTTRVDFAAPFASGVRLLVQRPLTLGAVYRLADGLEGEELLPGPPVASFVAGVADDVSPARPDIRIADVRPPPKPEDAFCSGDGTATLEFASDEDVAVVEVEVAGRRYFDLLDDGRRIFVSGVGDVGFSVVVLDAAGNSSPPATFTVAFGEIPPAPIGCSGCGDGGGDSVVLGLLPVTLLRRRRLVV